MKNSANSFLKEPISSSNREIHSQSTCFSVLKISGSLSIITLVFSFSVSLMTEGTRSAKIDDAIKSLNESRKETETQIRDINNTNTRFMQVVDHKMENKIDSDIENPQTTIHTPNNNNYQHRSMKINVPHLDRADVSGWIFNIEQFFFSFITLENQRILIFSFHLKGPALS